MQCDSITSIAIAELADIKIISRDEAPVDKSRLTVVLGVNDPMDPKNLKRGQTKGQLIS